MSRKPDMNADLKAVYKWLNGLEKALASEDTLVIDAYLKSVQGVRKSFEKGIDRLDNDWLTVLDAEAASRLRGSIAEWDQMGFPSDEHDQVSGF